MYKNNELFVLKPNFLTNDKGSDISKFSKFIYCFFKPNILNSIIKDVVFWASIVKGERWCKTKIRGVKDWVET